jgi:hypothetical protein
MVRSLPGERPSCSVEREGVRCALEAQSQGACNPHLLETVVAQIEPDGAVRACSERLSIWPYRYEDLMAQLRSVGLTVQSTTFDPESDGYPVVASRDQARGTSEPVR